MKSKDIQLKENYLKIVPLVLLIAIIPLIVFMKVVVLNGDYLKYWTGSLNSFDFYSYYKAIGIVILSLISFIMLIYDFIVNRKINEKRYIIIIVVYSALIILSTILSEHKFVSVFGFVERYEGMIIWLCYLIMLICTIRFVKSEKSIKFIIIALFVSAIIMSIIGISQFIGKDFFQTSIGKSLILPKEYEQYKETLRFTFEKFKIVGTVYHYNYMGSYMAMVFPLALTLFIFVKGFKKKAILMIPTALFFFNWIGSGSRAGFVGGLFAAIALIIVVRKKIIENNKLAIGSILIIILLALGINTIFDGVVFNRLKTIFSNESNPVYRDIRLEENCLVLEDNLGKLKVYNDNGEVIFADTEGNTLNKVDKNSFTFAFGDERYKEYIITKSTVHMNGVAIPMLNINKRGAVLDLRVEDDGKFQVFTAKDEFVPIEEVLAIGFKGKEKMGSARGYIWSRSIPMLKDSIFLGYGPDTFAIEFPNNDYVGKLAAYDTTAMLVDKPHNLYLQIALSTGIVSLFVFLVLVLAYIKGALKHLINSKFDDFYSIMGTSILVAIIGYLGAGLFNDSIVSVAPVFWILLGIGIGINYKMKVE